MAIDFRRFNRKNVREWMRLHCDDFEDATSLAVEAANQFGRGYCRGPLDKETHWIWEIALEFID